jgi:hypothetical protein
LQVEVEEEPVIEVAVLAAVVQAEATEGLLLFGAMVLLEQVVQQDPPALPVAMEDILLSVLLVQVVEAEEDNCQAQVVLRE